MKNFASTWKKVSSISEDRCLILTLTGGSGHIQAAHAKKAELTRNHSHVKIYSADVMTDWLGPKTGNFFTGKWNRAQRRGDLISLEFYTLGQRFVDSMLWIPLFISALRFLSVNKISWIIDTQNMGMGPIIKAIRLIHYLSGRKISYEKIITDLPTKRATHFFGPVSRLSKKDRTYITLVTTKPLLETNDTEEAFWKESCKLPISRVRYENLPLRPSFKKFSSLDRSLPLDLDFQVANQKEFSLIEKALSFGSLKPTKTSKGIKLTISPKDKVSVLMLGANPHAEAILEYIKHFISIIKEKHYINRKDHLFVFCMESHSDKQSLLTQIIQLIESTTNFPSSLTIVPLSYQNDEIIAPLYHRSDATFTRSGGLTSMEILSACQGHVWVHKGTPPRRLPKIFLRCKTIREGMPPWEKGNADYLKAKKGALFITPDSFLSLSSSYFEEQL